MNNYFIIGVVIISLVIIAIWEEFCREGGFKDLKRIGRDFKDEVPFAGIQRILDYLFNKLLIRQILNPYFLFPVAIFLSIFFWNNKIIDKQSDLIYFITFIALMWYARETHALRKEEQKQTSLQTRPFLRLEFNWDYAKQWNGWIYGYKYYNEEPPILQLVNDGKGIARDVSIHDFDNKGRIIKFDKISVIGPNSQPSGISKRSIKYSNGNKVTKLFKKLNPKRNYELIVTYRDVNKNEPPYKYKFISDPKDKDGFRIEELKD